MNGLISSVNQFLNYVTLLEGGIGSVIMAILYKPLYEKDEKRISKIINSAIKFFKQISFVFVIYVIILSFGYPLLVKTSIDFIQIFGLVWILAINLFFQYILSISYRLLLNADRKVSFVSIVQSIIILINLLVTLILVGNTKSILLIKSCSALVFLIQPIVFFLFVRKHYKINSNDGYDEEIEKHRWDGLGVNTAYFIHSNTDIIVLTIFASLNDVSIYTVYLLVVKAMKNLVSSISAAIIPSIGNILATRDGAKINQSFNTYETGIGLLTTMVFTCGMILITPFVDVYTLEITDANYHQTIFGMLLVLSEMIYCYRDPYVATSYAAGHIKQVSKYAYLEAIINITVSLILVNLLGLPGVAIGTIIAMLYRTIMQAIYLSNNITHNKSWMWIKKALVCAFSSVISIVLSYLFVDLKVTSYLSWILLASKITILVLAITIIVWIVFLKKSLLDFIKSIQNRKNDN